MIKKYAEENGISGLFHFTKISNVDGILKNGLCPRADLVLGDVNFEYNDEFRYDGYMNSSCLSISFPAYRMFYKCQCAHKNIDWAILRLKPEILWEKDCAFSVTNAAHSSVTEIPLASKKGHEAFLKLFGEIEGKAPRKELNIPANYPTDPQAEVLVFGNIEPELITDINVRDKQFLKEYDKIIEITRKHQGFAYYYNEPLFKPRIDWPHWKI